MESDPFIVPVTEEEIRRERQKARELRNSQWWKNRTSKGLLRSLRRPVSRPASLTMDHLVPVIRGGKTAKGNVVPSCKACNTARQHSLPF